MWPVPKWWVVQPGMSSGWDLEGPTWWCAAVCSHAAWAVARGIRDAGSSGHVGREPPVDSRSGGAKKVSMDFKSMLVNFFVPSFFTYTYVLFIIKHV